MDRVTDVINLLTGSGFTFESAVIIALNLVALGYLYKISGRMTRLLQACNNFHSRAATFLGLVSKETGLTQEFLILLGGDLVPSRLRSKGPLTLSRRGAKVAKRLNVTETARQELPKLQRRIGKDATEYDIQVACFEYAVRDFPQNMDGEVKKKVHREAFMDGGNMHNVLMVYGIKFRDAVLERRGMES